MIPCGEDLRPPTKARKPFPVPHTRTAGVVKSSACPKGFLYLAGVNVADLHHTVLRLPHVSTASGMCCANAALFECKKKKNTHFNPGFWGQKETTLVSEHRVKRMNELGHHLGTKLTCRQRDVQEVVGQHISRKAWHGLTAGSTTPNSSLTTSASFAISRHGRLEVTLRSAEAEAGKAPWWQWA